MNKTQEARLKQFMNDKTLSEAVYDVLLSSFMKKNTGDVYIQAASKMAIDNLNDSWKELKKYQKEEEVVASIESNVGV